MTVVDLSGLPSEILSVIVGVLCRLAFEYKYWGKDPNLLPLTLVLEEAHNYLPRADDARHRVCLDRVERIAKEGRKYGVNMLVVSQRPSEVSETVLSQCGNFVVLRLTNPRGSGVRASSVAGLPGRRRRHASIPAHRRSRSLR